MVHQRWQQCIRLQYLGSLSSLGGYLALQVYKTSFSKYGVSYHNHIGAAWTDRGDPDVRVAWPSSEWGSLPLEV